MSKIFEKRLAEIAGDDKFSDGIKEAASMLQKAFISTVTPVVEDAPEDGDVVVTPDPNDVQEPKTYEDGLAEASKWAASEARDWANTFEGSTSNIFNQLADDILKQVPKPEPED